MLKHPLRRLSLCLALAVAPVAWADCVDGITVDEARDHWNQALAHEEGGRAGAAVIAYRQAQGYICGGVNPVELEAARRAAPLAKQLAAALEQQDRLIAGMRESADNWGAFEWYEAGAHFAEADRVLFVALTKQPEDLALFDRARQHFGNRSLPSFSANNRTRLQAVAGYSLDRSLLERLGAIPAERFEITLKAEAENFSEAWLQDLAALHGHRNPTSVDFAAIQQAQTAEQAFARKWPEDRMKRSFDLLETARQWSQRTSADRADYAAMTDQLKQRRLERGDRLLEAYARTPILLESAQDFYLRADAPQRVTNVAARANALGEEAFRNGNFRLAGEFYRIAGNDEKMDQAAAREERQIEAEAGAMAEAYQAQALQMQQQMLSNPGAIEAMQKQAAEMIRLMQQNQGQFQQQ